MAVYKQVVRCSRPNRQDVRLQQGSALSPYVFLILVDMRKEVPQSMMFADDIVLCGR